MSNHEDSNDEFFDAADDLNFDEPSNSANEDAITQLENDMARLQLGPQQDSPMDACQPCNEPLTAPEGANTGQDLNDAAPSEELQPPLDPEELERLSKKFDELVDFLKKANPAHYRYIRLYLPFLRAHKGLHLNSEFLDAIDIEDDQPSELYSIFNEASLNFIKRVSSDSDENKENQPPVHYSEEERSQKFDELVDFIRKADPAEYPNIHLYVDVMIQQKKDLLYENLVMSSDYKFYPHYIYQLFEEKAKELAKHVPMPEDQQPQEFDKLLSFLTSYQHLSHIAWVKSALIRHKPCLIKERAFPRLDFERDHSRFMPLFERPARFFQLRYRKAYLAPNLPCVQIFKYLCQQINSDNQEDLPDEPSFEKQLQQINSDMQKQTQETAPDSQKQ